uniref:protein-ribulosamine 3-kinase n=1 Tax=Glycine max TaxID=3847 RepID=A0A0R0J0V9_SOYBN
MTSAHVGAMSSSTCFSSLSRPLRPSFTKTKSSPRVLDHPFFFLAQHIGPSMFEAEALGLGAMYETGTIRVPKPYKVGLLPTGGSFIIMEFIQFGASRGYQSDLGRKLAEMHKAGKSSKGFGFDVDNTIGRTETGEKHGAPVCQCGDRTMLTTWRPLEWKHQF